MKTNCMKCKRRQVNNPSKNTPKTNNEKKTTMFLVRDDYCWNPQPLSRLIILSLVVMGTASGGCTSGLGWRQSGSMSWNSPGCDL
jgi:hypothetical protein